MTNQIKQFVSAQVALMNRWSEESDIEESDLANIAIEVIVDWMEEAVVGFESDDDFFDDAAASE